MPDAPRLILCPYCGNTQRQPEDRCAACGGFFDPLSIKITQQHLGPWFVRDRHSPFRPGCSYEVLVREIEKGKIHPTTIIRGPTTRQYWSIARHVPGVAHRLGFCHACGIKVNPASESCPSCGAVFFSPRLRDNLGLAPAGADVPTQPTKLTETGSFPVEDDPLGKPDRDEQLQLGALARAFDPQPTEINSDDRPVIEATARARADRDAMTWIAGHDAQEPDTLTTTADAPTAGGWTWMLISLNVVLLISLVAAIVVLFFQAGQPRTPAPPVATTVATPLPMTESAAATEAGESATVHGAPPPTDEPTASAGPASAGPVSSPPESEPLAQPQPAWPQRYEAALQLEAAGQFDEALAALQTIKSDAPADPGAPGPADLDQSIDRVQSKLNRLALEKLFGE